VSLRARIRRLERSFSPDEVTLWDEVAASYSAEYGRWLDDEVGAGRKRHGKWRRVLLEMDHSPQGAQALLDKMNEPAANPKPRRPPPPVEGRGREPHGDPADSRVPELRREVQDRVEPVPEPVRIPAPEPANDLPAELPARIVRFVRSTDPEWQGDRDPSADYRPWDNV